MSVDNYFKYLNPQSRVLLEEYKKSIQNQMWATTIILSLTIIDNILSARKLSIFKTLTLSLLSKKPSFGPS